MTDEVWADAALAVRLFALAPHALGGVRLRARPGPQRDIVEAWLRTALAEVSCAVYRLPLHVTEDRLLGGVSLAATLRQGVVVRERGILARAHGGVVMATMAERLDASVVAQLAGCLDDGVLFRGREGRRDASPAAFGVVALDEGRDEERPALGLLDRLAFSFDLETLDPRSRPDPDASPVGAAARVPYEDVGVSPRFADALCRAAGALGIEGVRPALLACRVARAHAAWSGRNEVVAADANAAARLVLGPRALQLPSREEEAEAPPAEAAEAAEAAAPNRADAKEDGGHDEHREDPLAPRPLEEMVVDAAESGIPSGLLDTLVHGRAPRAPTSGSRGAQAATSTHGGRPAGTRAGVPREGERLSIVDTLRAAAPWQRLRVRPAGDRRRRIEVRRDDFRVRRYQHRSETLVIFLVDASGSAALRRLAEAKGAIERVLVDCYTRRDHVALVSFRGVEADILLPPTRSLARVRRQLVGLAGGGTTPLAAGIDAGVALALDAHRRGRAPLLVVMTDGRANVARDGSPDPVRAAADALAAAGSVLEAGLPVLFLDTAPRPRPRGRGLAEAMGAHYLPLPYVDARGISQHVQALAAGAR
ncbi:MAG: magnesium chelatase subunit D [Myxococcota bacterium]